MTKKVAQMAHQNDTHEIRRPSVKRLLEPVKEIGFTLSPYPHLPAGPPSSQMLKTLVKQSKSQKYAFYHYVRGAAVLLRESFGGIRGWPP